MKWDFQKKLAEYGIKNLNSDTLDDKFVFEANKFLARVDAGNTSQDILASEDQKLVALFYELHDVSEEDTEELKALRADNERLSREKSERDAADKAKKEEKEAKIRAEREAAEKAEKDEAEKKEAEKAEKEAADKEASEKAEAEKAEKEAADKLVWTDEKIKATLQKIKDSKGRIHNDVLEQMGCPKNNIGRFFFNWNGYGFNKQIFKPAYFVENQRG